LALQINLTVKAAVADEVMRTQPWEVVHLATVSFVGQADNSAFYDVKVLGIMNPLSAVAALHVNLRCVLLASSRIR
jgi:hypothetical protein